ncbi:MAG: septum formation protein Maf [Firmicutes bacterium]|mgnify:CR=1 FL=1|nr:septum formation protein Maf [Bacillota bacterium]
MNSLILASASPRRAALLKQIGVDFRIIESCYKEPVVCNDDQVEAIALGKAREVGKRYPESLVLGADTLVVCNGEVLGKPQDEQEARFMLAALSGKPHKVVTGVALVHKTREMTAREETMVWMKPLAEKEIDAYIASGEPFDKAGSYAVQGKGAVFVQKVDGCFFNVVGLPLQKTVAMLEEWNYAIW